jgi:hypothetical protein
MSNNRTRGISDIHNVQVAVAERAMPGKNPYSARWGDGKGFRRMDSAANNVTTMIININLSGPAQPGSVQKAKSDFDGLFNQAFGGSKFDHKDRARLNELTAKHRESLTNEADRAAFDKVTDAFNQSWGGKHFGQEDRARFNARVAGLSDVAATAAQAPAAAPAAAPPAPAAPAVAASSTNEYFDKYYLANSFVGASLYGNDTDRANKVREDLNRMQT